MRLEAYSELRKTMGICAISFDMKDGSSVHDFVSRLAELYGAKFREETKKDLLGALEREFILLVNGKSISYPRDGKLKLDENSNIVIMRPIRGG